MITIYTTLRSFEDERIKEIQTNAIESWLQLKPQPEIVVFGDDKGVAGVCRKHRLIHIPLIKMSRGGTPFIDDLIKNGERVFPNQKTLLLVAGDILLDKTTMQAAEAVQGMDKFLVCARKKEWFEGDEENEPQWKWHTWMAGDFFLYSKGLFDDIPPFLIGRCAVDNYMYRMAVSQDAMVNASDVINVTHQSHPHGESERQHEIQYNRRLYRINRYKCALRQWETKPWYHKSGALFRIDIRFANYIMNEKFEIEENLGPKEWPEPITIRRPPPKELEFTSKGKNDNTVHDVSEIQSSPIQEDSD